MTLLDRYTIIDRIAAGGMATIYRATDERLDRIVCVKLLSLVIEGSGSTSGGNVYQASYAHFLKEALALSKLQHPNTLRIYDFGYLSDGVMGPPSKRGAHQDEGGRPFQISEFLDGGNLEQHVRARGPLKRNEALAILDRVCGAVSEANSHDIIHRDIKPSNILFSRVGGVLMPKLADFGIARTDLRKRPAPGEEEDTEVLSTIPLFSPRWAAPEQLAGTEEGPATDVYALGLVTAFMLAGSAPFDVEDVRRTFAERVRGDDLLVSRLADLGITGDVRNVLIASMRANPRVRIATSADFLEAMTSALGGGVRTSLPPPVEAPRATYTSLITLEARDDADGRSTKSFTPPERVVSVGGRSVRVVDIHEKIDIAEPTAEGFGPRFRVTLLPGRGQSFRMHLKGLNCFVARPGGGPSPALVADADGAADLVSMTREKIGALSWSFGAMSGAGRSFRIGDGQLVIPPTEATHALALEVGRGPEVIVICRRA
jgi:serine/threonine-protein kinase